MSLGAVTHGFVLYVLGLARMIDMLHGACRPPGQDFQRNVWACSLLYIIPSEFGRTREIHGT
ncbi:hypothetical protein FHW68_004193 [Pseudomonas sp. Tn43]|nr:hypothetical protein [Pseudomonas sp. Tn43]